MIIDCGRCTVRGAACPRCAVTFITEASPGAAEVSAPASRAEPVSASGPRPGTPLSEMPATGPEGMFPDRSMTGKSPHRAKSRQVIELDAAELRSLGALANAGLIPPLRYAPPMAKAS